MGDGQETQMILDSLTRINDTVVNLDKKLDKKFDGMSGRVTQENTALHDRINIESTQRIKTVEKVSSLSSRVNWLYILVGGLFTSFAAAVFGLIVKGG